MLEKLYVNLEPRFIFNQILGRIIVPILLPLTETFFFRKRDIVPMETNTLSQIILNYLLIILFITYE